MARPGFRTLSLAALILMGALLLGGCGLGDAGLPTLVPVAGVPTATNTAEPGLALPTPIGTEPPATTVEAAPAITLPPAPTPEPTATWFLPTITPIPTWTPRPNPTLVPSPPPPAPPPTATPTGWVGSFYANRDLNGEPAHTRAENQLAFNWGTGAPAPELPVDGFSARWTRTFATDSGLYRFAAIADDGLRVWVDNQLLIDEWHDATNRTYSVEKALAAGTHTLKVEYYENFGDARLQFWWESAAAFPQWRGQYYANRDLSGGPLMVREEPVLSFYWGEGAPVADLPADGFSARWTRTLTLDAGAYRFYARADDGVRLFLDDAALIDEWKDTANRTFVVDRAVSSGSHTLRVEYYENLGAAYVAAWWERLDGDGFWLAEFYDNPDLAGAPQHMRYDSSVDFEWGEGAPQEGLPADDFSVRWLGTGVFTDAVYRFHVAVDDGLRVYVAGDLVVDDWQDGGLRQYTVERQMRAGTFPIRVEYYDRAANARVKVWWERVTSTDG
jgi:hypothetical protein